MNSINFAFASNTVVCLHRRERRGERASTPPRFHRGRGGFNDRGRGFERGGRGRGRGRGGSVPAGTYKGPQLTKQNSSDMGNEEWETASESSDVLEKRDSKSDIKDNRDKRDPKKSFSSQRPLNDRQNRRNSNDPRKTNSSERPKNLYNERSPNSSLTKNGFTAQKNEAAGPKKPQFSASRKENIDVYRVDEVVLSDQTAINNAINNSLNGK